MKRCRGMSRDGNNSINRKKIILLSWTKFTIDHLYMCVYQLNKFFTHLLTYLTICVPSFYGVKHQSTLHDSSVMLHIHITFTRVPSVWNMHQTSYLSFFWLHSLQIACRYPTLYPTGTCPCSPPTVSIPPWTPRTASKLWSAWSDRRAASRTPSPTSSTSTNGIVWSWSRTYPAGSARME